MEKKVFKSKILYWFSIIFFSISTLLLVTTLSVQISSNFYIFNFIYFLILTILSIIICIKLFEKEKNVLICINVFLPLLIILILFNSFKIYSTHYIYEPENIIIGILLIIYLFVVNKKKISKKDIAKIDEIEKIGN